MKTFPVKCWVFDILLHGLSFLTSSVTRALKMCHFKFSVTWVFFRFVLFCFPFYSSECLVQLKKLYHWLLGINLIIPRNYLKTQICESADYRYNCGKKSLVKMLCEILSLSNWIQLSTINGSNDFHLFAWFVKKTRGGIKYCWN